MRNKFSTLSAVICAFIVVAVVKSVSSHTCDVESSSLCKLANHSLACCPVKDATCCQTGDFCCPRGFECDLKNSRCIKDEMFIPFYLKMELLDEQFYPSVGNVGKDQLCPDNVTICKERQTCCNMSATSYGCCPIDHAHCCDDGVHCCPKNYKCNPSQGKCDRESDDNDDKSDNIFRPKYMDWLEKEHGRKASVPCPGGSAECPTGSTCCQLSSGQWGCCPLPNAVCCEDHVHCCPEGYVCDVKDGRCNKQNGDEFTQLFKKIPSLTPSNKNDQEAVITPQSDYSVVCPGSSAECPTGSTCCQLSSGQWACCPLPNAVCCDDHVHCCPQGYVCDVKDGRCNKQNGEEFTHLFKKIPSRKTSKNDQEIVVAPLSGYSVVCPDGCSFCPNGNTCCKMTDGSYGCCPLPKAVCCEDHLHCCPENTKCNVRQQTCESASDDSSTAWFEKVPSKSRLDESELLSKVQNDPVLCGDGVTKCDPLKVCCKLPDATYGCCPFVDGICCPGQSFCCPGNTVCGNETGECLSIPRTDQGENREWKEVSKVGATSMCSSSSSSGGGSGGDNVEEEKKKLGECTKNSTACRNSQDELVCCWYPNGVCCGQNGLCCPNGYTCDQATESCTLNDDDSSSDTVPVPVRDIQPNDDDDDDDDIDQVLN